MASFCHVERARDRAVPADAPDARVEEVMLHRPAEEERGDDLGAEPGRGGGTTRAADESRRSGERVLDRAAHAPRHALDERPAIEEEGEREAEQRIEPDMPEDRSRH